MLVEPDYRGHRIEVNAVAEGKHWNADVIIRCTLSSDKPHSDRVTCYKLTAEHAEWGRGALGAAVDRRR
jgi:hypothetical protein